MYCNHLEISRQDMANVATETDQIGSSLTVTDVSLQVSTFAQSLSFLVAYLRIPTSKVCTSPGLLHAKRPVVVFGWYTRYRCLELPYIHRHNRLTVAVGLQSANVTLALASLRISSIRWD